MKFVNIIFIMMVVVLAVSLTACGSGSTVAEPQMIVVTATPEMVVVDFVAEAAPTAQVGGGAEPEIASPVEAIHKPMRCIVRHREVGRDVLSFKEGTIQSLRQDPDIIVIGEMRDPDTIMTALEVTDSGHKVFSTLHTASAVESIDRIIAECPPGEQERVRMRLADTLKCVISQ